MTEEEEITKKELVEQADAFSKRNYYNSYDLCVAKEGFIAGAISRQPEIYRLVRALQKAQDKLFDYSAFAGDEFDEILEEFSK